MNIEMITRTKAAEKTGMKLPTGCRWYWVSGLQFYPNFGDWSHTWAEEDGLSAIIGKRKPVGIIARVALEAADKITEARPF